METEKRKRKNGVSTFYSLLHRMTRLGSGAGADYLACMDGRGNVVAMADEAGSFQAAWDYNAFGEPIKAIGALKDSFHFGWASKFTEPGQRLINCSYRCAAVTCRRCAPRYGKRFYDMRHGRFISRDPIRLRKTTGLTWGSAVTRPQFVRI